MNPTQPESAGTPPEVKPGETIAPSADTAAPSITGAAAPAPSMPSVASPQALPVAPSLEQSQVQFTADATSIPDDAPVFSWQATEFIDHRKSAIWYGVLLLTALVVSAAVFGLTRDIISTVAVIGAFIAFGGYAARHPKQLQYSLYEHGLQVGTRYFNYTEFRSFSPADDVYPSIVFTPLKRFGQLTTIYFDQEDAPLIMDLLSDRLPMEPHKLDAFDRFVQRIHF